ncbi:HNH endonuclease [Bradyrhizobium sp. HKCCYLRH3097]|uniref:HNH endonuclease n=1 Tax=Bradyrhizobium sp. HKCCYLRH3097 TaxID=3420752 RepID=UPI003EBDD575
MSSESKAQGTGPLEDPRLIRRSVVEPGKRYPDYRQTLRHDFYHACAYCTIMEYEAQSIGMVIDHYEPQKARPDLTNDYDNLMYACSVCNERKSDRYPPPEARRDGRRFFRPDHDAREEHFSREGLLLEPLSEVGKYSISALHLNRAMLLKLRDIRKRASNCEALISHGISALRSLPIDSLPQHIKGRAASTVSRVMEAAETMSDDLDSILRTAAKSELIDPDPNAKAYAKERDAFLAKVEALYPGKPFRPLKTRATRKARR